MASSFLALSFASSIRVSKAIARSIAGSPTIFRKPKDSSAATTPTSIPRMSRVPTIGYSSFNATQPCARRSAARTAGAQIFKANDGPAPTDPPSMAGEAQQMAGVVHELMHIHTVEDGSRALFAADEIDRERKD